MLCSSIISRYNEVLPRWKFVKSFLKFPFKSLFFICFLISNLTYSAWAIDYVGKTINAIEVEGLKELNPVQIISFLPFKVGDQLTPSLLRAGLQNLFEADFISDVKFDIEEDGDGIRVTVKVKRHISIDNIFVVGNTVFNDFKVLAKVKQPQREFYIRSKMNSIKYKIIELYLEKGYLDIDVDYFAELSKNKPNQVDVTFEVREGNQYLVKDIRLSGTTNFSGKDFHGLLATKLDSFFTTGTFDPNRFEADKQKINYFFKSQGYYKSKILSTKYEYEWKHTKKKKAKYVIITVDVELGELYYFGDLEIRGNTLFTEEEFRFDIQQRPGDKFNQSILDKDITSIYQKYQQNGYIFSRVIPIEKITEGNIIHHIFDIYEGQKARIERIIIRGLEKTKPNVVSRQLRIREGETFDIDKINLSLQRLNRLDYFSKVTPDYRSGSAEGLMNLNLVIQEKPTGKISGGFTYGFSSGFSLVADYTDKNFLGEGHTFAIKGKYGFTSKDLTVSFTDTWVADKPISLGGSISIGKYFREYQKDKNLTNADGSQRTIVSPDGGSRGLINKSSSVIDYTEDKLVFSIFSGQRFAEWWQVRESIGLDFSHEYLRTSRWWPEKYSQLAIYEANKDLFTKPPPIDNGWNTTYVLGLGIDRDSRDSIINPTSGMKQAINTSLSFNYKSYISWSFTSAFFKTLHYRPIAFPSILFKLTGVWKTTFKTLGVPIFGNYRNTGYYKLEENKLRGWDYNSIYQFRRERFGNAGLIDNKAYFQSYVLHNFELRQTLGTDLLQLTIFFDLAGASHNKFSLIDSKSWVPVFNFSEMMMSTGFGVRVNFPQFPMRFYWAWRLGVDPSTHAIELINHNKNLPAFVFDVQGIF